MIYRHVFKPQASDLVQTKPEFYQQKSLQPNTSANLIVIADVALYMTFIEEVPTHEAIPFCSDAELRFYIFRTKTFVVF